MNADQTPTEVSLLREYVNSGSIMQIATTSKSGEPWMAHCWFAADDDLNLIFMSRQSRKHSRHIIENDRVSGGILAIPLEGLGQTVRGVTLSGTCEMVRESGITRAYEAYRSRWPQIEQMATAEKLIESGAENRLWRISPSTFVLFDELHFPDDPRRELTSW
jgi:uncharacterized protein YhbP (UPF0306 family)